MHYEEARDIAPDFKVTATSGDIIAGMITAFLSLLKEISNLTNQC